jgi:hypothetical protein
VAISVPGDDRANAVGLVAIIAGLVALIAEDGYCIVLIDRSPRCSGRFSGFAQDQSQRIFRKP